MEIPRITLPPITAPGEVTTFYSFESGTARSVALSNMAVLLAGRHNATVPVLMIDWDTESPGLHHFFDQREARPGVLEYFEACRDSSTCWPRRRRARRRAAWRAGARGGRLGAVRRAGRPEPSAVPDARRPLRRQLRRARRPDGLGRPVRRLPGAVPLLRRAHGAPVPPRAGRCAQRPLGRRQHLHHAVAAQAGDPVYAQPAQPRRTGRRRHPRHRIPLQPRGRTASAAGVSLAVLDRQRRLRAPPAMAPRRSAQRAGRLPDRARTAAADRMACRTCRSTATSTKSSCSRPTPCPAASTWRVRRTRRRPLFPHAHLRDLLDWVADGHFPWQSHAEVGLLAASPRRARSRADGVSTAVSVPLAADLKRLGDLYRQQGRERQAQQCFEEARPCASACSARPRRDPRQPRQPGLPAAPYGKLNEAKFLYDYWSKTARLLGGDHPETLAARAGLAATLAELRDFMPALACRADRRRLGTAVRAGPCDEPVEPGRGGTTHSDGDWAGRAWSTNGCSKAASACSAANTGHLALHRALAVVLCELAISATPQAAGRRVRVRERHAGSIITDPAGTRSPGEVLVAQGDLRRCERPGSAGRSRERRLGAEHLTT